MSEKYDPLKILKLSVAQNTLSHAYLLYGDTNTNLEPSLLGAMNLILESENSHLKFKNIKQISHPNIEVIFPENNLIKQNAIKKAKEKLFSSSLDKSNIKLLVILNVEKGNKTSLNSLLKFIEEPVKNLIVIFTSNSFDDVLKTITSRTQNILIRPQKDKSFNLKHDDNKYQDLYPLIFKNADLLKDKDKLSQINQNIDKLFFLLDLFVKNHYDIVTELSILLNKENQEYLLKIMQLFYFDVIAYKNKINTNISCQKELLIKYQGLNINYSQIHIELDSFQNAITRYGNFKLQKIAFLLKLKDLYDR